MTPDEERALALYGVLRHLRVQTEELYNRLRAEDDVVAYMLLDAIDAFDRGLTKTTDRLKELGFLK